MRRPNRELIDRLVLLVEHTQHILRDPVRRRFAVFHGLGHFDEVSDKRPALVHDHVAVVRRDAVVASSRSRKSAGSSPNDVRTSLDFFCRDGDRHQIGIGEIAVVARFFLLPLRRGSFACVVPAASLLGHVAEFLAGLPARPRTAARPRRPCARSTARKLFRFLISTIGVATVPVGRVDVQVDVGVDAQAPFLHVAVGDAEVGEQQLQLVEIRLALPAASACRAG